MHKKYLFFFFFSQIWFYNLKEKHTAHHHITYTYKWILNIDRPIIVYQRWIRLLSLGSLHKLRGSLHSCRVRALNIRTNVIWKVTYVKFWIKRVEKNIFMKSRDLNKSIWRRQNSPIITPCSCTSMAKSLKISFTSPICSWISLIPCSLSSIMASLNAISLSNRTNSCLNKEYEAKRDVRWK